MLKEARDWVKEFGKPYKHEDQKTRDKRQLVQGIVNLVAGSIVLSLKLINLTVVIPIKALFLNPINFTSKYKELGKHDLNTIEATFERSVTGLVQTLTSPLIPFKIIARLLLTPPDGVSVFKNNGLNWAVEEYFNTQEINIQTLNANEPQNSATQEGSIKQLHIDPVINRPEKKGELYSCAENQDILLENVKIKALKYTTHKQKDYDKLNDILRQPALTYYKMSQIKRLIADNANTEKKCYLISRAV